MFVIMGARGTVGAAVVRALLEEGQEVVAVTHDPAALSHWDGTGVTPVVADARDSVALGVALRRGRRAFLLNPPAPVDTDTDQEERRTLRGILDALASSGLEKVVAESTAGARPGERLGDLSVLWELEQGLAKQPIPAAINRAAFHMSNWDGQLDEVRRTGVLTSVFPAGFALPMVAPRDLGRAAARRLMAPVEDVGVKYVEGPRRYTALDVAAAFTAALHREVRVEVIPREKWVPSFRQLGFSQPAAESYAGMVSATLDELDVRDDSIRGEVTLEAYVEGLVRERR